METIEMLINDLESEILKAKNAAFSRTDIIVNKAAILDILSRIRTSYPIALKEAAQIRKDRDEIIHKAETYANETMDNAEAQAREMISANEITRRAQEAAQQIQDEAARHYEKMDFDARALAFNLIDGVEQSMKQALVQIKDRKDKLRYE